MKKLAIGVIAIGAMIGAPVLAADLNKPVYKAPPPPPPAPVYSWTGWYVGGNVGYSWGDARTDVAGSGTIVSFPLFIPFTNPPLTVADSQTDRLTGVIGGGQLGYNYQVGPQWLIGFEADIQGSGERGSNTFNDPFSGPVCDIAISCGTAPATITISGAAVTSYEAKIDWFGTVRGRLGYLINNQVLLYATGGLAYGGVSVSGNATVSGSLENFGAFPPATTSFSEGKTNTGFTVGGGVEGKFWLPANWTWKLEYLYLDLGSLDTTNPFPPAQPAPMSIFDISPIRGTFTTHTHFTDNIVRVGLNYQFH
jgi:outer membrane immunogenic protein